MIGLEVGNLNGLVAMIILIMLVPAIILFIIGIILTRKKNKKAAKVFYILGVVYLVISFGTCGSMMA